MAGRLAWLRRHGPPIFGVAPSCAWQERQVFTPGAAASLSNSFVSVVVRSAGWAVLSGGCLAASEAG